MKKTSILWGLLLFGWAPLSGAATSLQLAAHMPGEVLVQLKDKSKLESGKLQIMSSLHRMLGNESVLSVHSLLTDSSVQVLHLAHESELARTLEQLNKMPEVRYAEPNFKIQASGTGKEFYGPNDPDFGKSWGLRNFGQNDAAGQSGALGADLNLFPLWAMGFTGSHRVVVAVIDTGIDWTHPDLAANLYTNPGEAGDLGGNGVDDDHNGFIDDIHGWNFVNNTNDSRDDMGHGSHCAGIIGAVGDNGIGTSGVNWNVSLMPVKFLDEYGGGTLENAVNAINYATMMKVDIMSNSWGGGGESQTMKDAIAAAEAKGILFVAAAGNSADNNDENPTYPASYAVDNIISVAATNNRDELASFSNYGVTTVHVAAPGVKVYSTFKEGKFETLSGTSMAAPHISGLAALMLAEHSDWSAHEIKRRLIQSSVPVPALQGKIRSGGRVDAYAAMTSLDETAWLRFFASAF